MGDRYWFLTYASERYHRHTYVGCCIVEIHPLLWAARLTASYRRPGYQDPSESLVLLSWRELSADDVEAMRAGAALLGNTDHHRESFDWMVETQH